MKRWIVRTDDNGTFLNYGTAGWEINSARCLVYISEDAATLAIYRADAQKPSLLDCGLRPVEIDIPEAPKGTLGVSSKPDPLEKLSKAVADLKMVQALHGERLDAVEDNAHTPEDNAHTPEDRWDVVFSRLKDLKLSQEAASEQSTRLLNRIATLEASAKSTERLSPDVGMMDKDLVTIKCRLRSLEDANVSLNLNKEYAQKEIIALGIQIRALESSRPAPAHGWRLLDPGEKTQPGDDWYCKERNLWVAVDETNYILTQYHPPHRRR